MMHLVELPGGLSLNECLAKGQNKLATLFHLLIKFRALPSAFTADVSMAYNGIQLEDEYIKFQKYLWKPNLDPSQETIIMVILTVIYGVRPSGNLTMEGFSVLAKYVLQHFPEHRLGALALLTKAYMDDILASYKTDEDRDIAAEGLKATLGIGSMEVKAITKSGFKPDPKVSADLESALRWYS